jgi:hypothetical protein
MAWIEDLRVAPEGFVQDGCSVRIVRDSLLDFLVGERLRALPSAPVR